MYGVQVEDLTRQPTPPPIFQVTGMEFKSQRPASGMSGNTWHSAGGSRPQSRAQYGASGSSTPSFTPHQPPLREALAADNTIEEKVRKVVEATLAATQSSRADDKLERLTDISTQLAKTMEMNLSLIHI